MDKDFMKVIPFILNFEGGYLNDPKDPGSEINFGLSRRLYPHLDIKNLSRNEAISIYYESYWNKVKVLSDDPKIRMALLDSMVHCGFNRIKEWIPVSSYEDLLDKRISYYLSLSNLKYMKSSMNRVERLRDLLRD